MPRRQLPSEHLGHLLQQPPRARIILLPAAAGLRAHGEARGRGEELQRAELHRTHRARPTDTLLAAALFDVKSTH